LLVFAAVTASAASILPAHYSRTETGKPTMSEKRRSIEAVDEDVAWDWRDHFFEELVNADISSLDLSQTLWDELSCQNNNDEDLELRSLLSTPDYCIDDIALLAADHSASFFQSSSSSCSRESSVEGDSDAAIFLRGEGGGENPRLKKRRLFNGPQQHTTSTAFSSDDDMGEEGDAPPAPVQDTMMLTVPPALLKVPKLETLSLSLSFSLSLSLVQRKWVQDFMNFLLVSEMGTILFHFGP
jgi:hypothetical protein